MNYIEKFIISFQLKGFIKRMIRNNVSPIKSKETIFVIYNGVKLKITSERIPGWQRINVHLDNHRKIRLCRIDCRRSSKRLSVSLNKKLKNEYEHILKSLSNKETFSFLNLSRNFLSTTNK